MCAMNFQTPDRGMRLNQAMFMANQGLGYVLKPYNSSDILTKKSSGALFRFKFIGLREWSQLCNHAYYIKLEIFGARDDQKRNKVRYIDPEKVKPQPLQAGVHHISKGPAHTYEHAHEGAFSKQQNQTVTVERETQVEFLLSRPKSALLEVTIFKKTLLSSQTTAIGVLPVGLLKTGLLPIQLYDTQRRRMPHASVLASVELVSSRQSRG